jgi:hypothetical protein
MTWFRPPSPAPASAPPPSVAVPALQEFDPARASELYGASGSPAASSRRDDRAELKASLGLDDDPDQDGFDGEAWAYTRSIFSST